MAKKHFVPMDSNGVRCYGVFAWFGIALPLQERLRLIREAGFRATAIWWESRDPVRRRLRHLAPGLVRDAGLYLDNIHVPYRGVNALWLPESDRRNAVLQQHLDWIEDCARHEVPIMVMHAIQGNGPGAGAHPTASPGDYHTIGLDSFGVLLESAEALGVRIAVENTRRPEYLDTLLTAFDSPALGLCYDVSHDWLHSPEPFTLLHRWGHRLLTTHINDTDGKRDRHWIPGLGAIPFSTLRDSPLATYTGARLLEITPQTRGADAEAFLENAWESRQALLSARPLPDPP